MAKRATQTNESERSDRSFVEGVDFYFEDGLMVLTEKFLRRRGRCCDNGCRHCPYDGKRDTAK